jgi:hypothetical protein
MESHDEQADRHEQEADQLEERGDEQDSEIENVKSDWDSKISDEQVPGAMGEGDAAPGGAESFDNESDPDAEGDEESEDRENVAAEEGGGPA